MGSWIDWRVTKDFTFGEWVRLGLIVERRLRPSLPVLAETLRITRPLPARRLDRLAIRVRDWQTARYARQKDTVIMKPRLIFVRPEFGSAGLVLKPNASPDNSGHSVGFQDFVSIGVLAAASQASGKVQITGGDQIDGDYVTGVLERLRGAGCDLSPSSDFLEAINRGG
jgi:hypothetical protein